MERDELLPKTIVYILNPRDNLAIAALTGCFAEKKGIKGKVQFGSGWWFCDQKKEEMGKQMKSLASLGLISNFVGMLTDSRSFVSYVRHDYFRRILCNMFGEFIDKGEFPAEIDKVGSIVKRISYSNAVDFIGLINIKLIQSTLCKEFGVSN